MADLVTSHAQPKLKPYTTKGRGSQWARDFFQNIPFPGSPGLFVKLSKPILCHLSYSSSPKIAYKACLIVRSPKIGLGLWQKFHWLLNLVKVPLYLSMTSAPECLRFMFKFFMVPFVDLQMSFTIIRSFKLTCSIANLVERSDVGVPVVSMVINNTHDPVLF